MADPPEEPRQNSSENQPEPFSLNMEHKLKQQQLQQRLQRAVQQLLRRRMAMMNSRSMPSDALPVNSGTGGPVMGQPGVMGGQPRTSSMVSLPTHQSKGSKTDTQTPPANVLQVVKQVKEGTVRQQAPHTVGYGKVPALSVLGGQPQVTPPPPLQRPQLGKRRLNMEDDEPNCSLLEELKCPGCLQFMIYGIFQCAAGHNICESCRIMMKKCPTCNKELSTTRNFSLESLARKCYYNCGNEGCEEKMLRHVQFKAHYSECTYANLLCPICRSWKGRLVSLKKHISGCEGKKLTKTNGNSWRVNLRNLNDAKVSCGIREIHGEIFFWKFDSREHIVLGHVKHIGLLRSRYTYEITVKKPNNKHMVHFLLPVAHVKETEDDIVKSGRIFCVGLNLLKDFTLIGPPDSIMIQIKIDEEVAM